MAALDQHPTVVAVRNRPARPAPGRVSASWLREICLAAGADDVGFVAIDRTEITADKADILKTFPTTRTLISIVCRMNREPVRNPSRSVANLEFHRTGDHVNDAAREYRSRVTDQESVSMWQGLSFGANYKAAYCLAVCPAGEDVISPFLDDRRGFLDEFVKPLQQTDEIIYVVADSDAEAHVTRVFPHKTPKRATGLRPSTIHGFLEGLKVVFQSGKAEGKRRGLSPRFHRRGNGRGNRHDSQAVTRRAFRARRHTRLHDSS